MAQEDSRELERKLEQTTRLASATSDLTTLQRLRDFANELRRKLQQHRNARRQREKIGARAKELWEQDGRPSGRDEEFWLKAEREILETGNQS